MIGRNWTEEEIALATKLGEENKTAEEISIILNRTISSVESKLIKNKVKYKKTERIPEWKKDWLKNNFLNFSTKKHAEKLNMTTRQIHSLAMILGLSRRKKRRIFSMEKIQEIINDFLETKVKGVVAKKHNICVPLLNKILSENNIKSIRYSKYEKIKENILNDLKENKLSMRDIGKKYEYSDDQIRNCLIRDGLYDEKRKELFVNKKPYYQCWVDKYGKEEADRREILYREKQAVAAKNKPYVYRDAAQGSGNGWKGWYDNHYFRSLRELCFIVEMDEAGIEWNSAEKKIYDIPYTWGGKQRIYRPDFVIGNLLYEIKPIRLHKSPKVSAKALAAHEFCKNNGLSYVMTDVEIKPDLIKKYYDSGKIKFDRDYEKRFLDFLQKNQNGL